MTLARLDSPRELLAALLEPRLDGAAATFRRDALDEVRGGAAAPAVGRLLALASRHARDRTPLAPEPEALERAGALLVGWNPERWGLLEALRVELLLAWPALRAAEGADAARALETLFQFADEGEQRALYRGLALLEDPGRFVTRAAEGCRTNILGVFEADVLDTPYPAAYFDDVAFRQAVLKTLFLGAPLWRLHGLDGRLSEELARMVLDYADERRSAGRDVPAEAWLALGPHGGERARASLERELDPGNTHTLGRIGAVWGLLRAGHRDLLEARAEREATPEVAAALARALAGDLPATFSFLHP